MEPCVWDGALRVGAELEPEMAIHGQSVSIGSQCHERLAGGLEVLW